MQPSRVFQEIERRGFWVAAIAASVVVALFGYPLVTGEVYTMGDLGAMHIPSRLFYDRCLSNGDSFLWNPFNYNGFYYHGEGQGGYVHPLNFVTYGLLPFASAFTIEIIRNYVFSLIGFFLFLRRWEVRRDASALGAILFAFCTFQFTHYMHLNFVGIASHIPWALWAVDLAIRGANVRQRNLGVLLLACVTASQHFLSHPQVTWMSLLAEGLYAAYLLGPSLVGRSETMPSAQSRRWALFKLGMLALGIALGFALAGIQLIPMLDVLRVSFRADPGEGFASSYAIHPLNLAQLLAPYLYTYRSVGFPPSANALYLGAAVPPLLVWLALRGRAIGSLFPLAIASVTVAAICLVLALGDVGVLARGLEYLPVVNLFRAPGRYALLTQLAAAIAAAIAYADLMRVAAAGDHGRLWPLSLVPLSSVVLTGVVLALPNPYPDSPFFSVASWGWIALGPLLLTASTGLVMAAARGKALAALALLVLTAADLGFYGLSYAWRVPPVDLEQWIAKLPGADVPEGMRINHGHTALGTRGVRQAFGYVSMIPDRVLRIGKLPERGQKPDAALIASWRVAAVAHGFGKPVSGALPRVRLVAKTVVSEDADADIASIDVETVALVGADVGQLVGPIGRVEVQRERPGEFDLAVEVPGRQLLIIAESYHDGWQARVDGERCPVIRVYGDFMGCVVSAGARHVSFRFDPESFRVGRNVTFAALAVALGFLVVTLRRA